MNKIAKIVAESYFCFCKKHNMAGFILSMNTFTAFNLFVMFGSLFELKNANFGIFLQPKIGNQGQELMSEAMFYGNCFAEREDLNTKAVLRFLLQFDL